MDQPEIPHSQQAQRDFLIQSGKTDDAQTHASPATSGALTSSNYYQPMTTYLGDLVRFLGTCDKQEQQEQAQQQQYHQNQVHLQQSTYPLQDTNSLPNFSLDSNEAPLDATAPNKLQQQNIPQLDLDTIIKKQHQQQSLSPEQQPQPAETGTLSDVLKQIQKEQQMQEMQVVGSDKHVQNAHDVQNMNAHIDVSSHDNKPYSSSHHFRHKSAGYQPAVSQQEFHELGMQEYDYTQQEYSSGGDRGDVQDAGNVGGQQHQELKLQYLNQYKPQENGQNRSIEHGPIASAWIQERDHELRGGGSRGDEGQLETHDNYGMYDSFTLNAPNPDAMGQAYFSEDIEPLKSQFFAESLRIKELLYNVRNQLSGDHWQKLGDAALAVDGLGFAFSNATHALAQEQLRTHQLQDQLSLTWQHVQRLRQEAIDLWNRSKAKEGNHQEESEVLKEELQNKNREFEQMTQMQERLQKENLQLKRELVRQVEQNNSGYVTAVSERNVLKDRLQQMMQDLKLQRTYNRDLERLLGAKGISLPSNTIRFPSWDPSTTSNAINTLRQQAQLLKAQQQQHQQLQQQQFLQRKASLSNHTSTPTHIQTPTRTLTSTPTPQKSSSQELACQDLPSHVQAPEPPEALDSPNDFSSGNAVVQLSNGVGVNEGDDEYSEGSSGDQEEDDEEAGGEEKGFSALLGYKSRSRTTRV
eukprot:TRINITY_DN284_c1_g1_i9.p1 TRINITY_DN284_c1_g1~~TRINITY_DN284_c1_g1_i9.p1  ORF type:complete len:693 (-),score=134.75 TRINITY_DN284_c1_g1_i9:1264-3342(-)